MSEIKFQDLELCSYFEENERIGKLAPDPDTQMIFRLFDAYDRFRVFEEDPPLTDESWPKSGKIREIVQYLVAPENRAALKKWYVQAPRDLNPAAQQMRSRLSKLIGEEL